MHAISTIEQFSQMLKTEKKNELVVALRKAQATVDASKVRAAYKQLRRTALDGGWV